MDERGTAGGGAVSPERLGERVRELRRARGLTLEELAAGSGVSRAMISKVERGEKNPTLVVAAKLAEGLGVSLSRLAGVEERRRAAVVRRDEQAVMRDPGSGFERRVLSPLFAGPLEFVLNTLPENESTGDFPPHPPGTEEYVAVARGRLLAVLDGEEYRLGTGDSLYFEADVTHRFQNVGPAACEYYLIIDRS
jgi:transcriptional regulator with XRE-family HTH domain